jgi:hypothetical protein
LIFSKPKGMILAGVAATAFGLAGLRLAEFTSDPGLEDTNACVDQRCAGDQNYDRKVAAAGLQRTFVSRDCPYFKVDVEFKAVGRPEQDSDGQATLVEDSRDIFVRISRPYLQFGTLD